MDNKKLEPEKLNKVKEHPKPKTWKNKIFNLYLPLSIWFYTVLLLAIFDKKEELSFWDGVAIFGVALFFTYGYLDSSGFLDKPKLQEKKKKFEEGFEKAFDGIIGIILKIIGWGLLVAIVGVIAYLVFKTLGSLSVSTLLIIIIVILLFKLRMEYRNLTLLRSLNKQYYVNNLNDLKGVVHSVIKHNNNQALQDFLDGTISKGRLAEILSEDLINRLVQEKAIKK